MGRPVKDVKISDRWTKVHRDTAFTLMIGKTILKIIRDPRTNPFAIMFTDGTGVRQDQRGWYTYGQGDQGNPAAK